MEEKKILDRDKLWLVFYLKVDGLDTSDIPTYIDSFHNSMRQKFDESVVVLTVPTRGENHVQFYSHEKLPSEFLQGCKDKMNELIEILNKN